MDELPRNNFNPFWKTWEALTKATNIGAMGFLLIVHTYTAVLLFRSGIIPEIILPTLIFDYMVIGGSILFWLVAGRGQRGGFLAWLSYLGPMIINAFIIIWQIEEFDTFTPPYNLSFPINHVFILIWMGLLILALLFMVLTPFVGLIQLLRKRIILRPNWSRANLTKTLLPVVIPLLLVSLAYSATTAYVSEGTVKRVITLEDTNTGCFFSIWDLPAITAQVNQTQEIDLGLLTPEENRTLMAFGAMHTVFYGQIQFNTAEAINYTIARLKLLDAYNLSVCATIWYTVADGFPGPDHPENWIAVARATLEWIIAENITNVIGICSDSEAEAECTPEEYWGYISAYDEFLQEVQTNPLLRHPDHARGTFETVLCFDPRALEDAVDGDYDIVFNRRNLGLPPASWTKYHFMLYRLDPTDNTAWLINYLTLAKEYLGVDKVCPIVGLTGVEWFGEGYYDGGYETFGKDEQKYDYDGIDGWEAMKREIFYAKAMGFHSVSVFHLNSYNCPGKIEDRGLLDYYGLEKVEELSTEWYNPKTVEYPVSSLQFELKRGGFFAPNGDLNYDLQTNIEMYVVRGIITIGVFAWIIYSTVATVKNEKPPQPPRRPQTNQS